MHNLETTLELIRLEIQFLNAKLRKLEAEEQAHIKEIDSDIEQYAVLARDFMYEGFDGELRIAYTAGTKMKLTYWPGLSARYWIPVDGPIHRWGLVPEFDRSVKDKVYKI